VSPDGLLRAFEAVGHAGSGPRGGNVACAAATTLLRTAARVCAGRGIAIGGGAGERGTMRCIVKATDSVDAGWLRGTTDFLLRGLQDLRDEFPEAVVVTTEVTED
jgi:uncharacterized protein YsxB (DUF464 family)